MLTEQKKKDPITAWLEKEYPHGIDLVYIDYNDSYESGESIIKAIKGEDDFMDFIDSQDYTINEVIESYEKQNSPCSDDDREAIRGWCFEHDTSTPQKDALKNTGSRLFFVETSDIIEKENSEQCAKLISQTQKKYAKTAEQKKEIETVINEQYYSAPVSFYFYADCVELYEALNRNSKYITIEGAHFGTVDRVQGSNWLGENGIFTITMKRDDFFTALHEDTEKGTGYGWGSIAGWCSSGYEKAQVNNMEKIKGILIEPIESEDMKRQKKYEEAWNNGRGKCTAGDMNMKRHKETPYRNDYPCGNKCTVCGTFWID